MAPYRLLNVFTAEDGSHGNPLAVFMEGSPYPDEQKQAIATDLNYSETVFVEDVESGPSPFSPRGEDFPPAGPPTVAPAWLIAQQYGSCNMLRPPAGDVPTWADGDVRWFRARPE